MKLTPKELEELNQYAQQLPLKVVEDVLKLNNEEIPLFPYLLNKYRGLHDIHIDFNAQTGSRNKGILSVYDKNYAANTGVVLVNDDKVLFLVDGFKFENDEFNKHVLEMKKLNNNTKDFSIVLNYELFGNHRLRCGINNSTILMRMLSQPLRFSEDVKSLETTFKFPYFEYNESMVIKNNEIKYETISSVNNEQVDKQRSLYVMKIHDLMRECDFKSDRLSNIKTSINLDSGDVTFNSHFILIPKEHRVLLEYVYNHFNELNVPLYSSIIKKAETFTSKRFDTAVIFNEKETIKSYMELIDMSII